MRTQTFLLILAHILFLVGDVVFLVAFSLHRWAEFKNGHAGLWKECDNDDCHDIEMVHGVRFIGGTRFTAALCLLFIALGTVADCFERCVPETEGPMGHVCRMRLKEISFSIASVFSLVSGIIYSSTFEGHYKDEGRRHVEWGASLIMVFVVPAIWALAVVIMYRNKDIHAYNAKPKKFPPQGGRNNKIAAVVEQPAVFVVDEKSHPPTALTNNKAGSPTTPSIISSSSTSLDDLSSSIPESTPRETPEVPGTLSQPQPLPLQKIPQKTPPNNPPPPSKPTGHRKQDVRGDNLNPAFADLQTETKLQEQLPEVKTLGTIPATASPWGGLPGGSKPKSKRGLWGRAQTQNPNGGQHVYSYTMGGEQLLPPYVVYEERLTPRGDGDNGS